MPRLHMRSKVTVVCLCVCACVLACVCACVRVCVRACACVCGVLQLLSDNRSTLQNVLLVILKAIADFSDSCVATSVDILSYSLLIVVSSALES